MILTEIERVDIAVCDLDTAFLNSADTSGPEPAHLQPAAVTRLDSPIAAGSRVTTVASVHPKSSFGTPIELVQE